MISTPFLNLTILNKLRKHTDFFAINASSVDDPFTVWNTHKVYIRGLLIQMCAKIKKQRSDHLNELLARILHLETLNKKKTQKLRESLFDARQKLRTHLIAQHDYQMRTLKAQSYRYGNKAGKLLASQLKEETIKQKIPYITNPKSKMKVTNPKEIADAFSDCYETLYNLKNDPDIFQPNESIISEFLASVNLLKISQTDLNQPFTLQEIETAIKNLPRNKAPGPDGYSSEYYQLFSTILSPHLYRMFEAATTKAKFPPEMLTATIITLTKPGKEPNLPQNFRPISLLNVDVKLHTKLIANKLTDLLPKLINYDQVGFVMGRQTTDATRRMLNLLHLVEQKKEPSLLLTLDAEKAFDRVYWGYLGRVLEKFGMTGPIQRAILALYSSPVAFVYTEGMVF